MKPPGVNLGKSGGESITEISWVRYQLTSPTSRSIDAHPIPSPVPSLSRKILSAVPCRCSASWRNARGSQTPPCRPGRHGGAWLLALETPFFPTVFHNHITFNTLLGSNNTEPAKYFHAPSQPSLNHGLHRPSPGEEMAFSARGRVGFLLSSPEIYLQTLGRWSWWLLLGGGTRCRRGLSPGLQGWERGWLWGVGGMDVGTVSVLVIMRC